MRADLVAVPRALLVQLHDHYCGPERTDPVADPLWEELGAYLDGRAELSDRLTKLAHAAHANSMDKGFWDDQKLAVNATRLDRERVQRTIPEKLALIHSEVSEALEDYRDGVMITTVDAKGKPVGFPSELADIVIRICDLAGALGIDLDVEIEQKMRYNAGRPRKHGKVC